MINQAKIILTVGVVVSIIICSAITSCAMQELYANQNPLKLLREMGQDGFISITEFKTMKLLFKDLLHKKQTLGQRELINRYSSGIIFLLPQLAKAVANCESSPNCLTQFYRETTGQRVKLAQNYNCLNWVFLLLGWLIAGLFLFPNISRQEQLFGLFLLITVIAGYRIYVP